MAFMRLVMNEKMKIYRRMGTWVMIGLLLFVVLAVGLFTKFVIDSGGQENWQAQVQAENQQLQQQISDNPMLAMGTTMIEERIAINEYRITHDIPPIEQQSLWGFMVDTTTLTAMAALFTIVIAAGIVASEFSWGTIKMLLIRPVSRSVILLSKYVTTLLFALVMLLLLFGTSFLLGTVLFGFSGADMPHLAYSNGEVIEQNMVSHIMSLFGFRSVDLLMMVTVAFMISTVFRSSSLAIGMSLFLMFTGPQMAQLLSQYSWSKYILFTNTDLQQYFSGTPLVEGMTLAFSVTVLAIYFLIFIVLSWYIFNKRDVSI